MAGNKGEICRHVLSDEDVWWMESGLDWTENSGRWDGRLGGWDTDALKVATSSGMLNKACFYQCDFKMEFDNRSYVVTCLYMCLNS